MDDRHNPYQDLAAPGLTVCIEWQWRVAALRHLRREGEFARACERLFEVPLPAAGKAQRIPGAPAGHEAHLLWRNPTSTLALLSDAAAFRALLDALPPAADGCCVDLSGGWWVLRLRGARVRDLLVRIGSEASFPSAGEARISRIAETTVISVAAESGDVLLLVDRAYAEHLLNWIRVTIGDFVPGT
ncbi:MAG: sarcosine oxidase subunit gamma family protein [Steroidobacteraceae bacterium]